MAAINMSLNNPMKIKRDWLRANQHLNSRVCVSMPQVQKRDIFGKWGHSSCTSGQASYRPLTPKKHQAETPDDNLGLSLCVTAASDAK